MVRGFSLTGAPGVSPVFLLIQTPVAFSVPQGNLLTVPLSLIFMAFVLIFVTQVEEGGRKWEKLNSAAKGNNLKCVSFQLLLRQTALRNAFLGLACYPAAFLQAAPQFAVVTSSQLEQPCPK